MVRPDGDYDTIVEGQAYHPDSVDEIVTQISLPWWDNVVLRSLPLADFGQEAHERSMGPEVLYGTRFEGENPSSGDLWFVEVRLFEYPQGNLQITDVDSVVPQDLPILNLKISRAICMLYCETN